MRYLAAIVVALALVAIVTRAAAPRRVLFVLLGIVALYAVLKLTGVVDAIAPSRTGVF